MGCAAVLTSACGKEATGPTRTPLGTDVVSDETGDFELKIEVLPKGDREVELYLGMKALGVDEMDKIYIAVDVDGFVLSEGSVEWTGFVPPRQPQSHQVTFKALDGAEQPKLTVDVFRSADSTLLLKKELAFVVEGTTVRPL
jgi:hypothetical protein